MSYIKYIVKFVLFWLIYFLVNRILFVLFFFPEVRLFDYTEIIKIFPNSIGLDISFICYMLSVICILFWISSFLSNQKLLDKLIYYFNAIISLRFPWSPAMPKTPSVTTMMLPLVCSMILVALSSCFDSFSISLWE